MATGRASLLAARVLAGGLALGLVASLALALGGLRPPAPALAAVPLRVVLTEAGDFRSP